jgi:hypothetical protein
MKVGFVLGTLVWESNYTLKRSWRRSWGGRCEATQERNISGGDVRRKSERSICGNVLGVQAREVSWKFLHFMEAKTVARDVVMFIAYEQVDLRGTVAFVLARKRFGYDDCASRH